MNNQLSTQLPASFKLINVITHLAKILCNIRVKGIELSWWEESLMLYFRVMKISRFTTFVVLILTVDCLLGSENNQECLIDGYASNKTENSQELMSNHIEEATVEDISNDSCEVTNKEGMTALKIENDNDEETLMNKKSEDSEQIEADSIGVFDTPYNE